MIAVFYSEDCVNHTFGAVSGRDDSDFTNSNCIIGDSNMTNLMLAYIPLGEYKIFGPGTRQSNPFFVTETEREVESKFAVFRMSNKLLTKMGKIGGTGTMKGFMPKGSFLSMSNKLSAIESSLAPRPCDVDVSNKLQAILHGNLMLESKSLPNCITSITAKTSRELSAVKHYFSPMIGVGVKKRAPTSREVSEGNNQFALQQADTIHMVNINFSGFEEDEANSSWFPDDASQRHHYFKHLRNYIKFRYDDRLREFRLTIKAMAIKIGNCDAEPVVQFIQDNGIEWDDNLGENDHIHLRRGRGVVIDNKMWVISTVTVNGVSLLNDDDAAIMINVTIDQAMAGLLPE